MSTAHPRIPRLLPQSYGLQMDRSDVLMSDRYLREVKIGVAPYSDGRGTQATVRARLDEVDGPVFEIEIISYLAARDWPELRQAIEDALRAVTPPPPRSTE